VLVTNQPDIARGTATWSAVDAINRHLVDELAIDDVNVCPHDTSDACGCRKPAPGMILDAARRLGADLARSVVVGDRWRDGGAAEAAGLPFVHIDHGYSEPRPTCVATVATSLDAAVPDIVRLIEHGRSPANTTEVTVP
jgi:D-glycero-D-manno-heptose 1,7-bisphosphate phosphatase